MAEAIAILGVVQTALSLVDYGAKIVKRLDEFNHNIKGLPESFVKIRNQLPLLLNIVEHLQKQASNGELDADTEPLLMPVLGGLRKDIAGFDETLLKALPSPDASNREKIAKAIRVLSIQKKIDDFRSSIQDYLNTLTAFQHTRHADSLRDIIAMIGVHNERLMEPPAYQVSVPYLPKPKLNPVWMVRYDLEKDFIGRDGIMRTIEKQLTEGNHRAALAGIGGVGKSRIAIQYSYRHRQLHPDSHIFWVHGGSRSRFESDYRNIARLLNLLDPEDTKVDVIRLVTDWLSDVGNGAWLMIVDNADDHDLWLGSQRKEAQPSSTFAPLIRHLPRCIAGAILATTRDRQLGHHLVEKNQQPLSISRLEPEEAQSLLSAKLPDQQPKPEGIESLARELEYLPLTITQAAAYLEQTEISASEYLELFRAGQSDIPNLLEESIYDPGRDHESSNSVFQTWRLSFEQLQIQSPKAADMLSLMAVLDRHALSFDLIRAPGGNIIDQKAAITKLKAYSLIQEEHSSKKLSLHRLVQLSTQRWLADHGKLPYWQKAAIGAVARQVPDDVDFDQWALIQELNSHVHMVLTHSFSEPAPLVDRARILHCLGHYTMEQGQARAALQFLIESYRLREEHLGSDDELTLGTLGLIGLAHRKLRQRKPAREVLEKFHHSTRRVLGPRHRLTLKSMSRLAVCYNIEGEYEKGKGLSLQTLQLVEEESGPNSEDTIRILTDLVYCCNKLHQFQEAEDIALRVFRQRMEQRGPGHPNTLTIMGSLAWTYREQSRFQEAIELYSNVLSRRQEILGPAHPKTQSAIEHLARTYDELGDWKKARELRQEASEAKERISGAQHNITIRAAKNLKRVEATSRNESDESAVGNWSTNICGTPTKARGRYPNPSSRGNHRYTITNSSPSYQNSVVHGRSDSVVSMPRFMGNESMTPITSPGTPRYSRNPSPSDPEFEDAHNEVMRTLQIVEEAQGHLGSLNRDLARHIQELARGQTTMKSAEFRFLQQDHRNLAYTNLQKAQQEHDEAKERFRSLGNHQFREDGDVKHYERSGLLSVP